MKNKKPSPLSHLSNLGYNKQKYTESEILEGVKNNDNKMYRFIYKSYYPGIKSMVVGFHSLALDADDIFQDGLVTASRNVMEDRFRGDSTFYTYLTSICRNKCFKQLEQAGKFRPANPKIEISEEPAADLEDLIYRLTVLKDKMDEKCRQIIELRFGLKDGIKGQNNLSDSGSNVRFEEIATILKIEPDNARQRFKRCLEKLRETVFNDRVWNDLLATTKY
ncbi:MAG: sigma-70 family RNA polymerase sigma factor [Lentimicrobium sp.]|jgi:RNA polymerase sigma factor (sigma-70 family)|nr:sigma-70 family RNA polymerase sigma factor [Lentimicrobium sp.]